MKVTKETTTGNWLIDGKTADEHTAAKLNRIQAILERIHAIATGRNHHGDVL